RQSSALYISPMNVHFELIIHKSAHSKRQINVRRNGFKELRSEMIGTIGKRKNAVAKSKLLNHRLDTSNRLRNLIFEGQLGELWMIHTVCTNGEPICDHTSDFRSSQVRLILE